MAAYVWSYETSIEGLPDRTAEEWLRAVWEQGPRFLRVLLPLAWKYGLGLRLGPKSDATHVLGWHIVCAAPNSVTVDADSLFMSAKNSVTVAAGRVKWTTVVGHKNLIGRAVWKLAQVFHQWLIPRLLRRSIRDQQAQ